ncbi:lysoplasmalogenase [Nocardioides immobilis]|uniref:Lysoplasmalogenase n=1 Tax=Nocardioides immobilis TaxID=2049295 RepID=A0A417Y1M4_9ACTN|nr:lysoplasmalogenase [Nocardioides immobilis]RHW26568.1 lysoplasmalogenase [Nocardioides immobilis]
MILATRLKAAYAGLALLDTALSASTRPAAHQARFLTKPLLMPLLSASLATTPGSSSARVPVLAAQAAGWVGDVALLSEERKPFVAGTTAFGVGHLAYLAAFVPRRRREPALVADPRARTLAAVWAVSSPMVAWNARRSGMAPVVATYSALLTSMVVAATRLDPAQPPAGRRLLAAGALLFLASDSTLGLRKFVLDDPSPWVEGAVMASYTSAQLLLSEGAGRL